MIGEEEESKEREKKGIGKNIVKSYARKCYGVKRKDDEMRRE